MPPGAETSAAPCFLEAGAYAGRTVSGAGPRYTEPVTSGSLGEACGPLSDAPTGGAPSWARRIKFDEVSRRSRQVPSCSIVGGPPSPCGDEGVDVRDVDQHPR